MSGRAMRDSGIEWIGEIPEHWDKVALKHKTKIYNGSTPSSSEPNYWNGDILWVSPTDLSSLPGRFINRTARMITDEGYKSCGTSLVPKNSIILSTRAPIGSIGIANTTLCTNQGCKSLVADITLNYIYLYYILLDANEELNALGNGSTFLELATISLANLFIPLPPP